MSIHQNPHAMPIRTHGLSTLFHLSRVVGSCPLLLADRWYARPAYIAICRFQTGIKVHKVQNKCKANAKLVSVFCLSLAHLRWAPFYACVIHRPHPPICSFPTVSSGLSRGHPSVRATLPALLH